MKLESIDNEALLDLLEVERDKDESNEPRKQEIVDILVRRGLYPITKAMTEHGYTALTMVNCWGARWHVYAPPLNCQHCYADLRDLEWGPPFKREIGQYDEEEDRTTHFLCPDCKKKILGRGVLST